MWPKAPAPKSKRYKREKKKRDLSRPNRYVRGRGARIEKRWRVENW
jgi:hypothetical protein